MEFETDFEKFEQRMVENIILKTDEKNNDRLIGSCFFMLVIKL